MCESCRNPARSSSWIRRRRCASVYSERIATVSASSSSSSSEVGWRGGWLTSAHCRAHALIGVRAGEQQQAEADERCNAVERVERGQVVEEDLGRGDAEQRQRAEAGVALVGEQAIDQRGD